MRLSTLACEVSRLRRNAIIGFVFRTPTLLRMVRIDGRSAIALTKVIADGQIRLMWLF